MTTAQRELEKVSKAIRNRRVCYDCATAISDANTHICPYCGGTDIDERRARPTKVDPRPAPELPHPWKHLALEHGGTVLLSGNAGSGKTTICMAIRPTRYISSEQEIQQVAKSWFRVNPELTAPIISNCYSWEQLSLDLVGIGEDDLIVVDSVSQLAMGEEANRLVKQVIEQVREAGARAIFIVQFRKDGAMLGPNELRHQVDAVATIPDDKTGLRRLAMEKNRYGGLFATYFSLHAQGVGEQDFSYAYSVEGAAGNYNLHLYPMTGGAKMTGILEVLAENRCPIEGTASAAIACPAYSNGFAEPPDVQWRQKFAEDHGLLWIDPAKAHAMLEEVAATREI